MRSTGIAGLAAALVAAACFGAEAAAGAAERGGVLFYAGFNGTRDAQSVGDGKAGLVDGGGAITGDTFGWRSCALRTGDGAGYVEYSAEGNILPDEGTLELWMKPEDWSGEDKQYHRFFEAVGNGAIRFEKGAHGVCVFSVLSPGTKSPGHFDDTYSGMAQRGVSSAHIQNEWKQVFLIWKKGEPLRYVRGLSHDVPGNPPVADYSDPTGPGAPSPGPLKTIRIGDFMGAPGRSAHTLIDEVYIYNRALTDEEMLWTNQHSHDRQQGMDIPSRFKDPSAKVVPDTAVKTLVVQVDSGDRNGDFAGQSRLEPAAGTRPAPIAQTEGRFGEARIPYQDLPQGEYKVISDVTTKDGKPIATITTKLTVPEAPVWLTEKVGVSDVPPPPWGPVKLADNKFEIWGRTYTMGQFGLPSAITTLDRSILAGPVELRAVRDGKDVIWSRSAGSPKEGVTQQTEAQVTCSGASGSDIGSLKWTVRCEFDGFLLYDFELAPAKGATLDRLELRVPIKKEYALLYYKGYRARGFLPEGPGTVLQEPARGMYWWIGTDDLGLCAATEHAGANVDNADDAFRIIREPNGDATVIYRFLSRKQTLAEPWKLRWVLQATPVKPLPKNWRAWRDVSVSPDGPGIVRINAAHPWPNPSQFKFFSFPVVEDPNWFRGIIKNLHARNVRVIPYSLFVTMPPDMPECAFYAREWVNPLTLIQDLTSKLKYQAIRMVPSYIDFMVWKHRQLAREYGHDGLYVDYAGVRTFCFAPEYGIGYVRNGKNYPADFPVVASREMWKRVYTMFKQLNPDSVMMGHDSDATHPPVLAFCDIWMNGESDWVGQLRDNYLEVLPLDQLRADFRTQQYGGIPWWLPQWYNAVLEDKDVASRQSNGQPDQISPEKTHHMFGLGLLLDIGFWPCEGMNVRTARQFYGMMDKFGYGDAEFSGYWNNAALVGGQTEQVKAGVYRKPAGGSLVVVYNLTREKQTARLTIAWERLKSEGQLAVVDAFNDAPMEVKGNAVTLEVPPLNYRLLWVK